MYEEINEPISVLTLFQNGKAIPKGFTWRGRKYAVDKINLEHREKQGEANLFCFAVESAGNSYELSFNSDYLNWNLDRIWTD